MIMTKLIILAILLTVIISFLAIVFMIAFTCVVIKEFINENKGKKDE